MTIARDEQGVATVLGAILVAALVATVFAHVQLEHVPVWEARAEARHSEAVRASLAAFHAGLIGTAGATGGASTTLPLAPDAGITGGTGAAHRISHESSTLPLLVAVDRLVKPNVTMPVLRTTWSETWVSETSPITDVLDVHSFRLRVDDVDATVGSVTVIAKDANDDWIGNFTMRIERDPPDVIAYLESRDGNGTVLFGNPGMAMHQTGTLSSYWVDILDPQYRYDGLLERAPKPLSFRVVPSGLSASHAISYTTAAPDGTEIILGGNTAPQELDLNVPTGRIEHHADHARLVPQRWILEHGALILAQDDGAVFHIPPAIEAAAPAGMLQLSLVLPVLQGEPTSIGGTHTAVLGAVPAAGEEHTGRAARLEVNITTAHPILWRDHLETVLQHPELPATNHTLATGTDWVCLVVHGPDADPNVSDISLTLRLPRYQLRLGA